MKRKYIILLIVGVLFISSGIIYQVAFANKPAQKTKEQDASLKLTKKEQALQILKKDYPERDFVFDKKTENGLYQFTDANQTEHSKILYLVDLKKESYEIESHTTMGTG